MDPIIHVDTKIDLKVQQQKQAIFNIIVLGSVANGKSTLVKCLTENGLDQKNSRDKRHSEEIKKNITIKLGYANAKIYKCIKCEAPKCYQSYHSQTTKQLCKHCLTEMELQLHVSFVDSPGHLLLLSTMLNGTCVMDGAILIESANNTDMPSPQTTEHLAVVDILGLKNIIVCMNKLDLVTRKDAIRKSELLEEFLQETVAKNAPIIPIVANFGINTDVVCEYICKNFKIPERNLEATPRMAIIRSFNTNKVNINVNDIQGGVIGGSLLQGSVEIGDQIEISPGMCRKVKDKWECVPIKSKILTIKSENNILDKAVPGGLIGIGLDIDSYLTMKDRLVGHTLSLAGKSPLIYENFMVEYKLLTIMIRKAKLKVNEIVSINHNASNIQCMVIKLSKQEDKKYATLEVITRPICAMKGDRITISVKDNGWGIAGMAFMQ